MADSFFDFGFDTTLPPDDDGGGGGGGNRRTKRDRGGGGREDEEELEYDALNDETFGSAINGDWEDLHENFVALDQSMDSKNGASNMSAKRTNSQEQNSRYNNDLMADLELNLSKVGMNDVPMSMEDNEGRINLDPSVWSSPIKPNQTSMGNYSMFGRPDLELMRRSQFPQPPFLPPQVAPGGHLDMFSRPVPMNSGPKMCTLEDIERNIREQQQQKSRPDNSNQSPLPLPPGMHPHHPMFPNGMSGGGPPPQKPARLPPGFAPINPQMANVQRPMSASPANQIMQPQGSHPPPPGHSNNFQRFPPMVMKMSPPQGYPMMPPPQSPQRMNNNHQQPPPPPAQMQQQQQMMNANHFNKRLVMEIQQTHPMLCYNRMNMPNMGMNPPPMHPMFLQQQMMQHHPHHPFPPPHMMQQHMNGGMGPLGNGGPLGSKDGGGWMGGPPGPHNNHNMLRGDGNLNLQDYDQYANFMSQWDKQWLIGIQLMQLNTETPYIDDYYYTVFKERRMKGQRENKIHKDNQLNHPFTQPQGHAQLVLQSIGNKNSMNNGQKGPLLLLKDNQKRERKNSESSNKNGENKQNESSPRTYTPLQFENSLGKLQCGSVTAPRKIIDMDVMGQEKNGQSTSPLEITAQRKSRQLLLHIETLYKVVLKVEDLKNPTAIEAALIMKEKRDKERKLVVEQQRSREANIVFNNTLAKGDPLAANGRLNIEPLVGDKFPEPETMEELVTVLVAGLTPEKVTAMMGVRKGKTLIRRALPHLVDMDHVWQTWCAIFSGLPAVIKKDRDDSDGLLYAFCKILKTQLHKTDFVTLIRIADSVLLSDKVVYVFKSKFGVGAIILMVLRAEHFLNKLSSTVNVADRNKWNAFLTALCKVTDQLEQEKDTAAPKAGSSASNLSNDLMEKLISHFLRFPDVVKSQSLFKALSRFDIDI